MANFQPVARLKEHLRGLIDRSCRPSEILETLRLSRLVLEQDKSAAQFPHLSLYCDWYVHGGIDRKALGSKMLERMNDVISQSMLDSTELTVALSRCISLAELRHEMIIFLISHSADTSLTDSFSNWRSFVTLLLDDLCERPIRLPAKSKDAEAIVACMVAKWVHQQHKCWPRAFFFVKAEDSANTFMWNVEMAAPDLTGGDSFNLRGNMHLTEAPDAFKRP